MPVADPNIAGRKRLRRPAPVASPAEVRELFAAAQARQVRDACARLRRAQLLGLPHLLPPLAGAAPAPPRGPSSATGGSSSTSQVGAGLNAPAVPTIQSQLTGPYASRAGLPPVGRGAVPDVREFGPWGEDRLLDNREGETLETAIAEVLRETPRGGALNVPRGDARIFTTPNLKGATNFRLIGSGGQDGSAGMGGEPGAATRIIYSGESATRAWDWRLSYTSGADRVYFTFDNPNFTGSLIDVAAGQLWDFDRCQFQGSSTTGTINSNAFGVFTAQSNTGAFTRCRWGGCGFGVVGRLEVAQFAIAVTFSNCWFSGNISRHILNPHRSWWFRSCVFENLATNKGVTAGIGVLAHQAGLADALGSIDLESCWFGNSGAVGNHLEVLGGLVRVIGGEAVSGAVFLELPAAGSKPVVLADLDVLAKVGVGMKGATASAATDGRGGAAIFTPRIQSEVTVEKEG